MEQYLVHHGIQGQKWGVRRYQNEDGTLTPAGMARYGSSKEERWQGRELKKNDKKWDRQEKSWSKSLARTEKSISKLNEKKASLDDKSKIAKLNKKINRKEQQAIAKDAQKRIAEGMKLAESEAIRNMKLSDIKDERKYLMEQRLIDQATLVAATAVANAGGVGFYRWGDDNTRKTEYRVSRSTRKEIEKNAYAAAKEDRKRR